MTFLEMLAAAAGRVVQIPQSTRARLSMNGALAYTPPWEAYGGPMPIRSNPEWGH